jgi:putative adhesin
MQHRNRRIALWAGSVLALLAVAMPLRADYRVEKNLKLAPGGQFILESDAGSVSVMGSSQQGAQIIVTSNRDDVDSLMTFSFEEVPGGVHVTARRKEKFRPLHNFSMHFEVRVPMETRLDIHTGGGGIEASGTKGDATLRTSGGGIEVSGVAGAVDADTSGGGVKLREVTGSARVRTSGGGIEAASLTGALDAHTSGGPIHLERVASDVRVDTSGGGIEITGAGGRVAASTSGGSVRVSFDRGNARGGELETSGGSIHIALDPYVNLNLEASASGGGVTASLPVTVVGRISGSNLHGTLGKGGETLRIHTSGGSIRIESL